MPTTSTLLPAHFVGRAQVTARFLSRRAYFRLFLYAGIAGIGKTSLLFRLAALCLKDKSHAGFTYVRLAPGESIASLGERLARRLENAPLSRSGSGGQDPYIALIDLLSRHRQVLLLDDMQSMRDDELSPLVRICQRAQSENKPMLIVGAQRGDPVLSAMEQSSTYFERLGGFTREEAVEMAAAYKLNAETAARFVADVARGGALAQPLTARLMLAQGDAGLPSKDILQSQSARSVHALRNLAIAQDKHGLTVGQKQALADLMELRIPIAHATAHRIFGAGYDEIRRRGLISEAGGDVSVHPLFAPLLPPPQQLAEAKALGLAQHLEERARTQVEPDTHLAVGRLYWSIGQFEKALDAFEEAQPFCTDRGMMDLFVQALSLLPTQVDATAFAPRIDLLRALARRPHAHASVVLSHLEELAAGPDAWTRARAKAALTDLYTELKQFEQVATAYASLCTENPPAALLIQAGIRAADAEAARGQSAEAEALIKRLLALPEGLTSLTQGSLCIKLASLLAHGGRLDEALAYAKQGAEAFVSAHEIIQVALAYNLQGDLLRELGDFAQAKEAYHQFFLQAEQAGDRDLMQVAKLADAWVALDIGDVAHAARGVRAIQKDLTPAPSRRLKRTLAAVEGLLEAGRGHHARAATLLRRVVDTWEAAGARTIAGTLNAQLIRSLIATDKLDAAEALVVRFLGETDREKQPLFAAALLRERAIIRLRRGDVAPAMIELEEAQQLFAHAKNRREEAMTLHRIGYAALDEGNVPLAREKAKEALELAGKIKHARAQALAHELVARVASLEHDSAQAIAHAKQSQQGLRRLGDALGVLHVGEILLHTACAAGDLAGALRYGQKLAREAHEAGMRDLRIRAVVLTGVALLKLGRTKSARKCFRPLPRRGHSAFTRALMWRFGEALELAQGSAKLAARRRLGWAHALEGMPKARARMAIAQLDQLGLPPRDRCELRVGEHHEWVGTEGLALVDPAQYAAVFDGAYKRIFIGKQQLTLPAPLMKLMLRLGLASPKALVWSKVFDALGRSEVEGALAHKDLIKEIARALGRSGRVLVPEPGTKGLLLRLPDNTAVVVPLWHVLDVSEGSRKILQVLRRFGTLATGALQEACRMQADIFKEDLQVLLDAKVVTVVKEGRSQALRLS